MIKRTERGWPGHFICADRCLFRRNTLLESSRDKIVVSTVGLYDSGMLQIYTQRKFEHIGVDRYYETMAFKANKEDTRYHDADASQDVSFDSPWSISELDADDHANEMHETVVAELSNRLEREELQE